MSNNFSLLAMYYNEDSVSWLHISPPNHEYGVKVSTTGVWSDNDNHKELIFLNDYFPDLVVVNKHRRVTRNIFENVEVIKVTQKDVERIESLAVGEDYWKLFDDILKPQLPGEYHRQIGQVVYTCILRSLHQLLADYHFMNNEKE